MCAMFARFYYVMDRKAMFCEILLCKGPKSFYPIISKTKGVTPKMYLECCVTSHRISPYPHFCFNIVHTFLLLMDVVILVYLMYNYEREVAVVSSIDNMKKVNISCFDYFKPYNYRT